MANSEAISSVAVPTDWTAYAPEPFVDRYAGLDDASWEAKVIQSIEEPHQDGIAFPQFPPATIQERLHGQSGEPVIREAFAFHRLASAFATKLGLHIGRDTKILDFGAGWGRTLRPFMAKTEVRNLFGIEPNPLFLQVARALNPYVSFVSVGSEPPTIFHDRAFDMVVAWSVFTHLPAALAQRWLEEFARIVRPGGLIFITAWGERFIDHLMAEQKRARAGVDIHWFHRQVIDAVGDLDALRKRYRAGEIVFVPSPQDPNYGDAFISGKGARSIAGPRLVLVAHDDHAISQDLLVYRRS